MTYTFVVMEVSPAVYDEVEAKLRAAGYDHAIEDGYLDMHGLALAKRPETRFDEKTPVHSVGNVDTSDIPEAGEEFFEKARLVLPGGEHGLTNAQEAWSVLRMLRSVVEELAPAGSVPNDEYLPPTFAAEGEALLCGIRAIADEARE